MPTKNFYLRAMRTLMTVVLFFGTRIKDNFVFFYLTLNKTDEKGFRKDIEKINKPVK